MGLEPIHITIIDFKSIASTNSATSKILYLYFPPLYFIYYKFNLIFEKIQYKKLTKYILYPIKGWQFNKENTATKYTKY